MSELQSVSTTLTAKDMERLDRLRRRCGWLKHRIANHRGDPGFDKADLSALEWAVRFIEDATAWSTTPTVGRRSAFPSSLKSRVERPD